MAGIIIICIAAFLTSILTFFRVWAGYDYYARFCLVCRGLAADADFSRYSAILLEESNLKSH